MINQRIFYQGMDIDPDDQNTLQAYTKDTFDKIVSGAVTSNQRYVGFAVTKNSATSVSVAPGQLYASGRIYDQPVATVQDLISSLPVAGQKIVTVILLGAEVDTNLTEREFLLDQATGTSQPKTVALEHSRVATVSFAYGLESPSAVAPVIQAGYTKVADILLTTTGVSTITMYAPNALSSSDSIATRTAALEDFEAKIGPEVSTLTSGLAALANTLATTASSGVISRILLSIAEINSKVNIPTTAADSSVDYLLDTTNSDVGNPLSSAKVQEGIRFPDDGAQDQVLNLFNPFETAGVLKGGVLFPAYARYLRRSTGPQTGTVSASSYTYNPVAYTQKTIARTRTRYGTPFTVCSNSAFWSQGTYDPISSIFTLPNGETFKASFDPTLGVYGVNDGGVSHVALRVQEYWTDTTNETYWDSVVQAPQTIAGYHVYESELIGQDQWLDAIGVNLGVLDSQGSMTLVITQAGDNAQPLVNSVLATVTLPVSSLVANTENVFSLATPILLSAGTRVSYGVVTTGNHQIGTTDGPNFPQGTFFALAPSGFAQGDLTKHLSLNFYSTKFNASTVSIQLQNLQLSGGITAIDILAAEVAPASTSRVWEIQIAGVWTPLSADTVAQLNAGGSLPPNLPLRVTLVGTPDMMPCVNLATSNAHVSRPKTAFTHIWPLNPRTPPVSTSQIRVIERFENFKSAYHAVGCKLLTGAGYTTQTSASSFSDVVGTDGSLTRTYVFNLGAAVSSYKVLTTGTTTSPLIIFHGAYIKDYVL